jgi:hypothetical protein
MQAIALEMRAQQSGFTDEDGGSAGSDGGTGTPASAAQRFAYRKWASETAAALKVFYGDGPPIQEAPTWTQPVDGRSFVAGQGAKARWSLAGEIAAAAFGGVCLFVCIGVWLAYEAQCRCGLVVEELVTEHMLQLQHQTEDSSDGSIAGTGADVLWIDEGIDEEEEDASWASAGTGNSREEVLQRADSENLALVVAEAAAFADTAAWSAQLDEAVPSDP